MVERSLRPGRCVVASSTGSREAGVLVIRIRRTVVIRSMAGIAVGWNRRVIVVGMALSTRHVGVCSRQREWTRGVIECGWTPRARVVADSAIRGESRLNVIGAARSSEIRLMAGVAGRGRIHIVVVGVTLGACQGRMSTGQRIVGELCVVKARIEPIGRRVAGCAIVGQTQLYVRRIIAGGEIGLMTGEAITGRASKYVIDMTRCARKRCVRPGKRITGIFQVIEFGIKPGVHGVAGLTCRGEARCRMVNDWSAEILLMARVTGG